ncbi:MAG: hypothetical protein Q9217_003626 [Psora testacea]
MMDSLEHGTEDDEASLSGSAHPSSGPDEAVFDISTQRSSSRTSHSSDDDVSVFESPNTVPNHTCSPFTPLKTRSPFRNPSSVRAMQTDITPPHLSAPSSPHQQQRQKLYTPSRGATPGSVRSHNSAMRTASKLSPGKKMKREYPLVLLHVTLLPPLPLHCYSPRILDAVLPPTILANWKLLLEKATPTVLERGVLIPHPREDYDLLEERLLESLELKQPRILKCGHFHLSPAEAAEVEERDSDVEGSDAEDADICEDCGRRIRNGRYGDAGTGSKRWDIKIFAANGLMRAGAWSAAWKEMERVDVEVVPWMEESMKRELELMREEEERLKSEQQAQVREQVVGRSDGERLREIYGQNLQDYVDGLVDQEPSHPSATQTPEKRPASRQSTPSPSPTTEPQRRHREEIPFWHLIRNCLYLAAQDTRNIAIFLLSALVLFLAMRGGGFSPTPAPLPSPSPPQTLVHSMQPKEVVNMASSATEALSDASASVVGAATSVPSLCLEMQEDEQNVMQQTEDDQQIWTETPDDVVSEMLDE